ncbi:hypothetical protein BV20DRAFT_614764 [Pilatotrama ljubarskyi]|nr:hypothetical protein BV20DRAFT_614764 [Pilatotrama ljubarskyi]
MPLLSARDGRDASRLRHSSCPHIDRSLSTSPFSVRREQQCLNHRGWVLICIGTCIDCWKTDLQALTSRHRLQPGEAPVPGVAYATTAISRINCSRLLGISMPKRSKRARTSIANLRQYAQKKRRLDVSPDILESSPPSSSVQPTGSHNQSHGSFMQFPEEDDTGCLPAGHPDRPTASPGPLVAGAHQMWPSRSVSESYQRALNTYQRALRTFEDISQPTWSEPRQPFTTHPNTSASASSPAPRDPFPLQQYPKNPGTPVNSRGVPLRLSSSPTAASLSAEASQDATAEASES